MHRRLIALPGPAAAAALAAPWAAALLFAPLQWHAAVAPGTAGAAGPHAHWCALSNALDSAMLLEHARARHGHRTCWARGSTLVQLLLLML